MPNIRCIKDASFDTGPLLPIIDRVEGRMIDMSRFQIRPGERIDAAVFGAQCEAYGSRVRRWP